MASDKTRILAFTIFRHGERNPLHISENDPHKNLWPEGAGNITKEGKMQALQLGEKYRSLYNTFLSTEYNSNEVYVYSTDTDRSLMTAACCMAGLFPPTEQSKFIPSLNWQPIPIHSERKENDPLYPNLGFIIQPEELYDKNTEENYPKEYEQYVANQDLMKKWLDFTSEGGQSHILKALVTMDTIQIKMSNHLSFDRPADVDITDSAELFLETTNLITKVHPYYIKQGCELLTLVLKRMKECIEGVSPTTFYFYSVHDVTIWSVFGQLNTESLRTKYCGFLTFELHLFPDKKYYVQLWHCIALHEKPYEVSIGPNLGPCLLETFEEIVKASQARMKK
ncbi:hypothetical protein CHUAL_013315 [Chamberlinius hualienensis]